MVVSKTVPKLKHAELGDILINLQGRFFLFCQNSECIFFKKRYHFMRFSIFKLWPMFLRTTWSFIRGVYFESTPKKWTSKNGFLGLKFRQYSYTRKYNKIEILTIFLPQESIGGGHEELNPWQLNQEDWNHQKRIYFWGKNTSDSTFCTGNFWTPKNGLNGLISYGAH